MHLAPTRILHVFEAGNRRAEVQYVEGERYAKYRIVYQVKVGDTMRINSPDYLEYEEDAKSRARIWVYRPTGAIQ